ncbi:MAG: hypothetical protein R2848_18590 [Thermomicrobiales bacterium]
MIDSEPLWRIAETRAMNAIGVPMVEEDGFLTMGLRTDESSSSGMPAIRGANPRNAKSKAPSSAMSSP